MVMNIVYLFLSLIVLNQFPIDQLNTFLERYPGLDELIEEFEHLSLAREDDDDAAITYFKRQRRLREETVAFDNTRDTKGKRKRETI
jgi:hypothetical protein